MILQTLYQNCVKHDVEFFNEFYALDIALTETENGPVATGVIAYELATGEIHVFHAKSIVFATGGSGRMYKTTSNAHTLTGDGLGIIFRKACRSRTWNSINSIRRDWPDSAFSSRRRSAVRAASCATSTASASWSGTHPPSRTSPPATSSRARWFSRCSKAAVPDRTRTTSTST